MINIFSRIKYGIDMKALKYAIFDYKEPIQERPYNISPKIITNIFEYIPRESWYDTIKPLLWNTLPNKNGVVIMQTEKDPYPFEYRKDNGEYLAFNLEDLKIKRFDIEPLGFYTHKELGGLLIAEDYVFLDERYKQINNLSFYRTFYGSVVEGVGISKDGYTMGWEKGHYFLQEDDVFYNQFERVNYTPKEGEFLYYIYKIMNNEIHYIKDNVEYDDTIFGNKKGLNTKFPIGDTSNRKYFESFFKEYQ